MSTQVTYAGAQAPGQLHYSLVRVAGAKSDLTATAQYMFWLMFRNVASDGLVLIRELTISSRQPWPPQRTRVGYVEVRVPVAGGTLRAEDTGEIGRAHV